MTKEKETSRKFSNFILSKAKGCFKILLIIIMRSVISFTTEGNMWERFSFGNALHRTSGLELLNLEI